MGFARLSDYSGDTRWLRSPSFRLTDPSQLSTYRVTVYKVEWRIAVASIERQYQDEIDNLKSVLHEVRDLIEGYVDVIDGDYGVPAPNKAMKAVQIIDDIL